MVEKLQLFGMSIDRVNRREAVADLLIQVRRATPFPIVVVTPNVDHVVQFRSNPALRKAYALAGRVYADGKPLVWASRLFGPPLTETVTGSDLMPELFTTAQLRGQSLTVYLLGAGPGVAEEAGHRIEQQWPRVRVVGSYSPSFGFEHSVEEQQRMIDSVNDVEPDVLAIGLGAPKQEVWATKNRAQLRCKLLLCIGAGIDFLAERKARAPEWMSKAGLEWLFRIATEPRRLWRRYAIGFLLLPAIIIDEIRYRRKKRQGAL